MRIIAILLYRWQATSQSALSATAQKPGAQNSPIDTPQQMQWNEIWKIVWTNKKINRNEKEHQREIHS